MTREAIPLSWLALGFLAQAMFSARFLIQWIASERRGRSFVPETFWWCSVAGGSLLLVYAIQRRDPVFIVGQAAGLAIYVRNLVLIHRGRAAAGAGWGISANR